MFFLSRLPIDEFRGLPRAQPSRRPLSAPCWLASRVLIYHLRDLIFLYAGMSSVAERLPEPCPEHVEGSANGLGNLPERQRIASVSTSRGNVNN